uniref:Putative secreted protein n=1 Tax=Anopheles marajoara TaxID=58244 RepID=A0A2M4CF46_9DIPT
MPTATRTCWPVCCVMPSCTSCCSCSIESVVPLLIRRVHRRETPSAGAGTRSMSSHRPRATSMGARRRN